MNSERDNQINDEESSGDVSSSLSVTEKLFGMEYGPLIDILSYFGVPELVEKICLTNSHFRRACQKTLEIREWTLTELYQINMSYRNVFQKYNLFYPKKVVFAERKLERVFGNGLKKIFVYYEDYISSDAQLRMFPLYVNPNCTLELTKMLFVLVWGNYPVRSGTELDADLYYKRYNSSIPQPATEIGGYADYFKSNAKWGEILTFTHHYVNPIQRRRENAVRIIVEFTNDMKVREIMHHPVIYCQVKGIIRWGDMYSYSPTYRPYQTGTVTTQIRVYNKRFRKQYGFENDEEERRFVTNIRRNELFEKVKKRELFINYLENVPNEFHEVMKKEHFSRTNGDGEAEEEQDNNWGNNLDFQTLANEAKCNFKIFTWLYEILKNRKFTVHRAMG